MNSFITALNIFNLIFILNYSGRILHLKDIEKSESKSSLEAEDTTSVIQDKYFSSKKLGAWVENNKTFFKLFAPNAEKVDLVIYEKAEDTDGKVFTMIKDSSGVWETESNEVLYGKYYDFRVMHKNKEKSEGVLCLDPYAKAVATYNTYMNPRKGIILKEDEYNWEGDSWIKRDWSDLIIYEMHIKDLTAHPTSGSTRQSAYKALVEKGIKGGIDYIKSLGVNTIELLPSQEFANIEIPYHKHLAGKYNTWNPYERNYWGYMTASFFSPAAYYAEDWKELQWNTWMGKEGHAVNQFKDMVKAFHKEGIAVIMDVVYNHISEYETGNLKEIDSAYYFRFDNKGHYKAESGCGNDFKTERPMSRRMIIESILYWMNEYHVDGFRFDLGKLIDWKTVETIISESKKVNPNVVFVCEPWGGGYDPAGFSLRGWGSWNDQIRNGIKGENPIKGQGWIFGKWYGNNNVKRIKSYVNGTLVKDKYGLFQEKEHSVNYLESHDGYTLGDFIRIGSGEIKPDAKIENVNQNAVLSPLQLKLNKLAALFLFTSQGITMIHEGQEFARSKVIAADDKIKDTLQSTIDHNSYNKDNETNFLNFHHADLNGDLLNYYKGLIELRKNYPAFRRAEYSDITFIEIKDKHFALGYKIKYDNTEFLVLMNAENKSEVRFDLPPGEWEILVNPEFAGTVSIGRILKTITLQPKDGYVLIRK
jgi:pullulanase